MVKPLSLARIDPTESSGFIPCCLPPPLSMMSPIIQNFHWLSLYSGCSLCLDWVTPTKPSVKASLYPIQKAFLCLITQGWMIYSCCTVAKLQPGSYLILIHSLRYLHSTCSVLYTRQ